MRDIQEMQFHSARLRYSRKDNEEIFRCVQKEWADMFYHYHAPDREERLLALRRIMGMAAGIVIPEEEVP